MKINNTPIFFLISFFSFLISVFSQNTKTIDTLQNQLLIHVEKDTLRVNSLNELAYLYFKKDLSKTLKYLDKSEAILKTIDFKKGNARIEYIRGKIDVMLSNYDQALLHYTQALKLYKNIDFEKGISECYTQIGLVTYNTGKYRESITYFKKSVKFNNPKNSSKNLKYIGYAYMDLGDYMNANKYLNKALTINIKNTDSIEISSCLNNLGNVCVDQANYSLALEYYNKSLFISEKINDTIGLSKPLNNIGIIHKNLQNYDKAINTYEKALDIYIKRGENKSMAEVLNNLGLVYKYKKEYNKALKFLERALNNSEVIKNKAYIAICLNNIGDVYLDLNEYKIALQYFEKGKKINLEVENQRGLCNSYLGIAKAYTNQYSYTKALANALKSKELSSKLELINYQSEVFELLTTIYKETGNYNKALTSHQQFKILNDSIFNKKNIEKIVQLESEYKHKQQLDSASIRELQLKKTVTTTTINLEKSQQNYLWAIICVLLISIILGSIIFYLKLRNIRSKTQNIVVEQKLLRSQMTPHFIFNSLSVLQGMILNKEGKKSILYLSKFSKLLRLTLENSRDKTVLLSEELKAIENYLALQNLENDLYTYKITVSDTIDKSFFKIPPMLIQPFVENAIEHAFIDQIENRAIKVHLSYMDKQLTCIIYDNGIGVDAKKENKNQHKKSLSTIITAERLKILSKDFKMKGSVSIEDRQKFNKEGTKVTLIIPYKTVAA